MNSTQPVDGIPDLSDMFDQLFPICRSICGPGIRQSLGIIANYMPLDIKGVASGTQVFDWTVPLEWHPQSATLIDPDGETVVDFNDHNLHLMSFSEAFVGELDLDELEPHLHSLPDQPDSIPYVTSYYEPRWGFCLTDKVRKKLLPGRYKINIDTEKKPGLLNYGVTELPGISEKVILISSYLCHPSMANNELSGPLALVHVYHALASMKNRFYTYRFLIIPETIGSITYLSEHGEDLKSKIQGGMVLTCLGGPADSLSIKLSRRDWVGQPSSIDQLARHLARHKPSDFAIREFTPEFGSDERQYCSVGFNLPMIQVARTIYGQHDEYHTSADDKAFMQIEQVEESARTIASIFEAFDFDGQTLNNKLPYCEPQLGARNLYPTINSPLNRDASSDHIENSRTFLNRMLMIMSLADGERGLLEIAEHIGCSIIELLPILRTLQEQNIVSRVPMSSAVEHESV